MHIPSGPAWAFAYASAELSITEWVLHTFHRIDNNMMPVKLFRQTVKQRIILNISSLLFPPVSADDGSRVHALNAVDQRNN